MPINLLLYMYKIITPCGSIQYKDITLQFACEKYRIGFTGLTSSCSQSSIFSIASRRRVCFLFSSASEGLPRPWLLTPSSILRVKSIALQLSQTLILLSSFTYKDPLGLHCICFDKPRYSFCFKMTNYSYLPDKVIYLTGVG